MTYWIVWNESKTEGFVTTDAQLAYEVRKGATSNCFDADGNECLPGIAFAEAWMNDNCIIEQVGPDTVRASYVPTEEDKAKFAKDMRKLHMNSTYGKGLMKHDLPVPTHKCSQCGVDTRFEQCWCN